MKHLSIEITNPTGLHARPAKTFVTLVTDYNSSIKVACNGKTANAKSLISLLTLGAEQGAVLEIDIDGDDEDQAVVAIRECIESGLGE